MTDETQTKGTTDAPDATPVVEDTAPDPQSEADVQTNNGAPEAAQEVKESETKAEDTADEKLYAGKYKSVEDMEKAYQELNSKFTNTSQEKAELARILNEAFATPEPATQTMVDDYQEEPNPLLKEVESLKAQTAVQNFILTHTDADASAINEVLKTDPNIKDITGHNAKLEYAYLRSQNMARTKAIAEAEKKSAQDAQVKFVEKQAAQVEGVAKQAQPADKQELTPSQLRDTLKDDKAFDELIKKRFPGISKMRSN